MLSALSLSLMFGALALSSFAVFWAKRLQIPHTVLLVLLGVVVGILSMTHTFSFLASFHLTPELLFFVFLPALIFESAYNMSARRLAEDILPITLLAVVSLVISTVAVGYGLVFALSFAGIELPLALGLLFGALISATDPVAVLALFKEYGAPQRLALVFEGESLFNDATAVALFLVLLDVVLVGFDGGTTILLGTLNFTIMILGGIVFGVICGLIFASAIKATRTNEFSSITLTVVLAYVTFLASELISHHLVMFGHEFHISAIIATTIASLVMGNYGRPKINPRAEEFVEKLWGQFAFMSNSIIFVLVGILFVDIPWQEGEILIPIALSVVVVALSRALSVYPVAYLYNTFTTSPREIPRSWQHLLSWGSLRGALAVTLVLIIPQDLSIPGWTLDVPPRDFILALTIGCIFFTIFIKATTIQALMRRLRLNEMTHLEQLEYEEACALTHREVAVRLTTFHERGYITDATYTKLLAEHEKEYAEACTLLEQIGVAETKDHTARVLRIYAIGIERRALRELYLYGEISEEVFRKISGKLTLQVEAVEAGDIAHEIPSGMDTRDIFERTLSRLSRLIWPESKEEEIKRLYTYYRAQAIISRKVLKELSRMDLKDEDTIFTKHALAHVTKLYEGYRNGSSEKMRDIGALHPETTARIEAALAARGVSKVEEQVLSRLHARELITPKLFITLKEEFHVE